jgi:hypothetical protein
VEGAAVGAPRERERLRLEAELGRLRSAPPSIGIGLGIGMYYGGVPIGTHFNLSPQSKPRPPHRLPAGRCVRLMFRLRAPGSTSSAQRREMTQGALAALLEQQQRAPLAISTPRNRSWGHIDYDYGLWRILEDIPWRISYGGYLAR